MPGSWRNGRNAERRSIAAGRRVFGDPGLALLVTRMDGAEA